MTNWYVLQSKPNKEDFVLQQLLTHSIDAYCPHIKVNPVNPRSRKRRPYFPGYLFVNANLDIVGTSVLKWIPGAIGLVDFGGELATIHDSLVQSIKHYLDQLNKEINSSKVQYLTGEKIFVKGGPLSGFYGIFDCYLSGRERVQILLNMLQDGQMKLELPETQIEHFKIYQSHS